MHGHVWTIQNNHAGQQLQAIQDATSDCRDEKTHDVPKKADFEILKRLEEEEVYVGRTSIFKLLRKYQRHGCVADQTTQKAVERAIHIHR